MSQINVIDIVSTDLRLVLSIFVVEPESIVAPHSCWSSLNQRKRKQQPESSIIREIRRKISIFKPFDDFHGSRHPESMWWSWEEVEEGWNLKTTKQIKAKPALDLMLSVLVQLQFSRVKLCRYLLAVMWRGVVTIKVVVLVVILTTLKEVVLLRKSSAWRKRGIRYSWDGVATCLCFENR